VYEPTHEREYFAIRNSAALIDISPLFKYEVAGPDALRLVDRVVTRDMSRSCVGQVRYSPWCNEAGHVLDDGTVAHLEENRFRITAAEPNLRWFQDVGYGLDAEVSDVSQNMAALSVQGPRSRAILQQVVAGVAFDNLGYFRLAEGTVAGVPVTVTRTGYTGDLGYELWVDAEHAEALWDSLMAVGPDYGMLPAGMVALDIARIEAGLLLIEVDYISARHARTAAQKSSPYELGLGWTVATETGDFVGRHALRAEKAVGPAWTFVGLRVDWAQLERQFARYDLPPQVAGRASRAAVPVYHNGRQIGQATSQVFSPVLKQYIAIGTLRSENATLGAQVQMEVTIEYSRETVAATVVETPFFDPPRKRA
jgi:aminomethyltransferase